MKEILKIMGIALLVLALLSVLGFVGLVIMKFIIIPLIGYVATGVLLIVLLFAVLCVKVKSERNTWNRIKGKKDD